MIRSRNIHPDTHARYNVYRLPVRNAATADLAGLALGTCVTKTGEVVRNVFLSQTIAGANGTSIAVDVKKNGTSIFTTKPLLAIGDGANATVDCLGKIAKPTGATRGVLKTDGAPTLGLGDDLSVDIDYTGAYSVTFPEFVVTVITEGF